MREVICNTWDWYMAKVLEYQKCKTELGIERNISIKNQVMPEVMFGIIDLMPPNNGYSTSSMVVPVNSSSKDGLLTSDSESGWDLHGFHLPFICLDHLLVKENMITMLMITSTSLIDWLINLFYNYEHIWNNLLKWYI